MPFIGVSFEDGLISVDKLQRMSDNDDYLYNAALGKPRGLIALQERTADYSNSSGAGYDDLFSNIIITPGANRLLGIFVFIPWYASGATGVLDSSTLQIMKNGIAIQTGYTDKKFISGSPHGDHTSFFYGCLDIKPAQTEHVFNVQIKKSGTSGQQILDLSTTRPAQFWIEDLGQA